MLDGVCCSSAPYLLCCRLFSISGVRSLLSTFLLGFFQGEVPAGDWQVGQGEKKVPPVSDGDRNGGSNRILASNISAVEETGLDQIFSVEMNCMRR